MNEYRKAAAGLLAPKPAPSGLLPEHVEALKFWETVVVGVGGGEMLAAAELRDTAPR